MKLNNPLFSYFQGVAVEMRKVVWPPFPVLVRYFVSVVVGIALATVFIGAINYLFIKILATIIK